MRGVGTGQKMPNHAHICTLVTLVNAGAIKKEKNEIRSRETVWKEPLKVILDLLSYIFAHFYFGDHLRHCPVDDQKCRPGAAGKAGCVSSSELPPGPGSAALHSRSLMVGVTMVLIMTDL